ncbi:hypothetical protein GCM10022403_085880 [Streptomyces coacervatus]|uniref:4-hydroxy-3-methylbut-2-en-1-yl diphosphate synthase (flavodoxin) n=1 Tax=Streptomyces coacervatus TaxID=647381 RepID=A0ABP7JBK6_9ACTN
MSVDLPVPGIPPISVRRRTRQIHVGRVPVGGSAPISVQTMTTTVTADVNATLQQIAQVTAAGCDIVRVAVPSADDAEALPRLVARSPIPVIADIHFQPRYVFAAIDAGCAGVRVNPGNIKKFDDRVGEIARAAAQAGVPIRIGVNAGSLDPRLLAKYGRATPQALVESALWECSLFEEHGFRDLKIAVKHHDPLTMIAANRLLAQRCDYPLHLGVTEAGPAFQGAIKSAVAFGVLLAEGIGDTIRVSLSTDPVEQVKAGCHILQSLGLRPRRLEIVSCPGCGRLQVDIHRLASHAYTTAQVARLLPDGPLRQGALDWLRRRQHLDGSWGGTVHHVQDRLVSTLAAIVTLSEVQEEWATTACAAGLAHVRRQAPRWQESADELIAFEVTVPHLLDQSRRTGQPLPYEDFAGLEQLGAAKLGLISPDLFTTRPTTLLYSLEALGAPYGDKAKSVETFTSPNGSLANSVAATAALYRHTRSGAALDYLSRAAASTGDGGFPECFPIGVFRGRLGALPARPRRNPASRLRGRGARRAFAADGTVNRGPRSGSRCGLPRVRLRRHRHGGHRAPSSGRRGRRPSLCPVGFRRAGSLLRFPSRARSRGECQRPCAGSSFNRTRPFRPTAAQGHRLPSRHSLRPGLLARQVAYLAVLRHCPGRLRPRLGDVLRTADHL